jgi:hypothetical protein
VAEALGLSREEAERVKRLVSELGERLKRGAKVSQLLEEIWAGKRCESMSLEERIFATFLLGAEVQTTIILSLVSLSRGKGEESGSGKASQGL